ncbi:hypothetical protein H0H92_012093 [Tricholoma furcatifolium]|nr:hypothetical protein H0H92_012093 [Tricholoma furcatifolium]
MSLNATYRDSSALRASVFDVCLQLGALDENSLVADWMFNNSSESASSGENTSTRQAPSRPTRFTETFSPIEVTHDPPRRRFLPFSLKAVTFPTHFCPAVVAAHATRQTFDPLRRWPRFHTPSEPFPTQTAQSYCFTLETRRSEIHSRSAIPFDTPIYSQFANPDRFDQRRILGEDHDDTEWEEVEVPDSPLHRLFNKGMNPVSPIKQRKSRLESTAP